MAGPEEKPAIDGIEEVDLSDPRYYLNRELSELSFQRRVLNEARDDRKPLLERLRFLGLFTQNLDEFFMKRIGGLKQQIDADVTDVTPDGRTPREQWIQSLEVADRLLEQQATCYLDKVKPALAAAGIELTDYGALDTSEQIELRDYFETSILPTLTPLSFDPAHPFPFISNLSLSLAVLTREHPGDEVSFSRVKIPGNRPRFVPVDDEGRYQLLEDLIAANLDLLFPQVEVVDWSLFRVTRNAEVDRNEEVADDLIDMIEDVIEQRRFATVVRLEVADDMPEEVRRLLVDELGISPAEVFDLSGPLDYTDFLDLVEMDRADLKFDEWTPKPHPRLPPSLDHGEVFEEIRTDDILIHHPYHSFQKTVQRFLDAAARDPDVLAIKTAIYRTAENSNVIDSLIRASRNGKQVAANVELKARFDEKRNLRWVDTLEEEGVHVSYGTIGLKTHTKTALVVREEGNDVRLYSHIGTGNYHAETAKTYEDLGLLTVDREIGQDLTKLFNFFTGRSLHRDYDKLLIAPANMKERFLELIQREAETARQGGQAKIVAKMNRLEHPEIVRSLYGASMAGVDIDLIVRDICRLRPGLEGVSENITVSSIVGRFLEHSRIFYFHNEGDGRYFIGSADWMVRNLENRVEAVTPVTDIALQSYLNHVLELNLADNWLRWEMQPDGSYERVRPAGNQPRRSTHDSLMEEESWVGRM